MVIALLACLTLQAKSDGPTVTWMTDFKDAQAQASRLGRPLVIDAGREA